MSDSAGVPEGYEILQRTQGPGFAGLVGPFYARRQGRELSLGLRIEQRHLNSRGSCHGGLLATLADSAMGCAVLSTCAAGQLFTTLELKLNFVRALLADSGLVRCEGTVLHRGGRIATAEARALDAKGRLYAHATSTCMILEAPR